MSGRRGLSEWQLSSDRTMVVLLEQEGARRAAGGRLSRKARFHFSNKLKTAALDDGDDWITAQVAQLKRWQRPGNSAVFHDWWNYITKRGRRSGACRSRFFDPTAMTAAEEAEGWAEFHKEVRTSPEPVEWEPIDSTVGKHPLAADIVDKAIDESKEDKATGPDDTPVTLWKRSATGRQALRTIMQLMWLYECSPDQALDMYVVFAHKPGRSWTDRKSFRPITLMNDLMKIFDRCLYHVSALEMGIKGSQQSYLSETQRAFQAFRACLV
eukprot:COSAG01_NODE_12673_length_1701_cov_6.781523_1_plen_269_part_00